VTGRKSRKGRWHPKTQQVDVVDACARMIDDPCASSVRPKRLQAGVI
jgi:hypothetical protein